MYLHVFVLDKPWLGNVHIRDMGVGGGYMLWLEEFEILTDLINKKCI